MGGQQSKSPDPSSEKVFREIPIQFSQDVINHLSDSMASPMTTPERQSTLDAHVRSRIQTELTRLRSEEEDVRKQIEAALARENLDREAALTGGVRTVEGLEGANQTSSTILQGDLDEIKAKVEKYQTRKSLVELPDVKEKQLAVIDCYRTNKQTPLNCWREVQQFKKSVAQAEQQFIDSLR